MTARCLYYFYDHCSFPEAYDLQMQLVQQRVRDEIPDTLLLLTHLPVYTIGRAGSRENILVADEVLAREGLTVYETDRGGDITYHGPGQLVAYPILDLQQHGKDLHKLLNQYEETVIRVLREYGIDGARISEYPGVWVGQEKICALGIGVTNWVSYHGWALNINPDMKHFSYITPCGIQGKKTTSLKNILGRDISLADITSRIVRHFGEVFSLQMVKGGRKNGPCSC